MRSGPDPAPLVSVVIPVYNTELYLAEAIQSVLDQTYRPVEVIVVDDGSTDSSVAVAGQFGPPVRCFQQAHGGASAARNFGVKRAKGSFLAFLDADDVWEPEKLARQVAALREDPFPHMVFGKVQQFRSPDLTGGREELLGEPLAGYYPGTMLIRTEDFRRVGDFSSEWRIAEFLDWYARAQDLGLTSFHFPDVVTKRRVHRTNTGIREQDAKVDFARVLKAALDRRRGRRPD